MWHRLVWALLIVLPVWSVGCGTSSPPKKVNKSAEKTKAATSVPREPSVEAWVTESPAAEPIVTPIQPEVVYRPDDQRPRFDDAALRSVGIQRYESKRLRLYTDIDAKMAKTLPVVIDELYDALTAYFGPMPPSRTGEEFQMTGYLIGDEARFRETGLIPENLPPIEHGRHRRNEFWLREQPYDYYRRHLLIHEATHCCMMYMPENRAPVWYLEGMAELFGTHRSLPNNSWQFSVMPTSPEAFAGFGRITLLRDKVRTGRARTLAGVFDYTAEVFLDPEPYAWSWAVCWFLDQHPRYSARFRELARNQQPRAFATVLETLLKDGGRDLATEWRLFITNLQYGYDVPRAAISFEAGMPLASDESRRVTIVADRGWQSTRCLLEQRKSYRITATGQFTLAQNPQPWVSEANGISFRYFQGVPLGKLQACVREEDGPAGLENDAMLQVNSIGSEGVVTFPVAGTLYLRLNDSWSEVADNLGAITVVIAPVQE